VLPRRVLPFLPVFCLLSSVSPSSVFSVHFSPLLAAAAMWEMKSGAMQVVGQVMQIEYPHVRFQAHASGSRSPPKSLVLVAVVLPSLVAVVLPRFCFLTLCVQLRIARGLGRHFRSHQVGARTAHRFDLVAHHLVMIVSLWSVTLVTHTLCNQAGIPIWNKTVCVTCWDELLNTYALHTQGTSSYRNLAAAGIGLPVKNCIPPLRCFHFIHTWGGRAR
jgi:hypothetical protein